MVAFADYVKFTTNYIIVMSGDVPLHNELKGIKGI